MAVSIILPAILAAIICLIALGLFIRLKMPPLRETEKERKRLESEISEAERMFLLRKITESEFREISERNNAKLIELRARTVGSGNIERETQKLGISRGKGHELRNALERKKELERGLAMAERDYLKRKIDGKTLESISSEKRKELVSVNAKAVEIYKERARELVKAQVSRLNAALGDRLEKRRLAQEIQSQIEFEAGHKADLAKERVRKEIASKETAPKESIQKASAPKEQKPKKAKK
ncbi:MAG: hypothetical protein WC602_03375 [archaeon]